MKSRYLIIFLLLIAISIAAFVTGCKYDVAQPPYDTPINPDASPTITAIEPAGGAVGGVNYISIKGTGFGTDTSKIKVIFGNTPVVYSTLTNTEIIMRRPYLVTSGDYV